MSSWLGTFKRRSIRRRSRPLSAVPGLAPYSAPAGLRGLLFRAQAVVGGGAATATIFIFLFLITVTTVLLMLPIASATGEITPLADALFTAVSAICVTGLTVVNMATHWSALWSPRGVPGSPNRGNRRHDLGHDSCRHSLQAIGSLGSENDGG